MGNTHFTISHSFSMQPFQIYPVFCATPFKPDNMLGTVYVQMNAAKSVCKISYYPCRHIP